MIGRAAMDDAELSRLFTEPDSTIPLAGVYPIPRKSAELMRRNRTRHDEVAHGQIPDYRNSNVLRLNR